MQYPLAHQFQRFLLAGGAATVLHFGLMWALITAGSRAWLASALGAGVGAAFNYLAQFHWTFASQRQHHRNLTAYLLVCALGWALNLAGFYSLHHILRLPVVTTQLLTSSGLALLNFLLYRCLVFL